MDECISRHGRHRLYGVPMSVLSTHSPIARLTPYTKSMNKQPIKLDMSAIMADYTQQVIREERRRQAIREGRLPAPQGQWGEWNISDRD